MFFVNHAALRFHFIVDDFVDARASIQHNLFVFHNLQYSTVLCSPRRAGQLPKCNRLLVYSLYSYSYVRSEFGNERKRLQRTVEFLKQREQKEIEGAVKAYMDWITLGGELPCSCSTVLAIRAGLLTPRLLNEYRVDRYSFEHRVD